MHNILLTATEDVPAITVYFNVSLHIRVVFMRKILWPTDKSLANAEKSSFTSKNRFSNFFTHSWTKYKLCRNLINSKHLFFNI